MKIILDGLCMSPYYDYYLLNELNERDKDCKILITTSTKDKEIVKNISNRIRCLDLINNTNFYNTSIGKLLRVIEYILNLIYLTILVYCDKVRVIHIQWLPLIQLINSKYIELCFIKIWKIKKVKIVYTVHNILPHDTGNKYYQTYLKVYNICDELICHTQKTANNLKDDFSIDFTKINIIPHGPLFVSPDEINQNIARAKLNLPDKKIVLFLGFLRPYKGVDFLLDSWRILCEKGLIDDSLLVIVGEGKETYKSSIEKLIDKYKLQDCTLTRFNFVSAEDVLLYHYAADLVVFPYKDIDQSGALYTAMATKKPIIATNVGGFKEVIINEENGILVEYNDCIDFSNKIINTMKDKQLSTKMVKNNISKLNTLYSWSSISQKTLNVYNNDRRVEK